MSRWFEMDRITSYTSNEVEISGKTKTNRIQITDDSSDGYVLTSDAEGNASWQLSNGGDNVFVNGGNVDVATQQLTFTNTTGGTFNVNNAVALFSDNDINVTGGTYNANTGCVTFGTNSGSTFDICGFVNGLTDTFTTGGVYDSSTNDITFTRTDNTTYNVNTPIHWVEENDGLKTKNSNNSGIYPSSNWSLIAGGTNNNIYDSMASSIVGGNQNSISGASKSFIMSSSFSEIKCGQPGVFGTENMGILGGSYNTINDAPSTQILGGWRNKIEEASLRSVIVGGYKNEIKKTSNNQTQGSIIGGAENQIYDFTMESTIIGGFRNRLKGIRNTILNGDDNHVLDGRNSAIIGGTENRLNVPMSSIVAGNSVIIGGSNITGTSSNTVYVPNLNIGTVGGGTPLINLGLDSGGRVVTGTTGSSTLTVEDNLILDDTTNATTSQAIYGINVITTATSNDLATKLPVATTGKQTVFINNSTMPILVFPSAVGGEINGVVDGYAVIPNDGKAYTFYCIENPSPGAWTWSSPALGQIQLSTIEISHTGGTATTAYGVGNPGAQLINPSGGSWFNNVYGTYGPVGVINLFPSSDYWATSTLTPKRTLVRTKVYSNIVATDNTTGFPFNVVQMNRYVSYMTNATTINNYSASGVQLSSGSNTVTVGTLSSPVEIGDSGTQFTIKEAYTNQMPPADTDSIGVGDFSPHYFTFSITIPADYATKVYKFNIFLEHT